MSKGGLLRESRYLDFCSRYQGNLVGYILDHSRHRLTWQQLEVAEAVQQDGARVAVASGHGCFGKGTPILLASGHIVSVEDIVVGDVIAGDDGTVRNVLRLIRGKERLYRFEYMDGGTSHVFNESHILCLVATQSHGKQMSGDKVTVTVEDWLKWSDRKKRTHAIYRPSEVSFNFRHEDRLYIPPYILGVWLGDGISSAAAVTTADREIIDALSEFAIAEGIGFGKWKSSKYSYGFTNGRKKSGGMLGFLERYSLLENKHIPWRYKTASIKDRLELLAGLIDTDGTLDSRGGRVFSITQKNRVLAEDIVFVARSVGIHASISKVQKRCCNNGAIGSYYTISLTRNIEKIPVRIDRKRPDLDCDRQRPNLHFGIRRVTPEGVGDYFGFELDGNHRFLSGDFTVLHNTGKSFLAGWILDWHLRVYPFSNALLTATNITQVRSVVWKYLDGAIADVERANPWMAGAFIKKTQRYFHRDFKDSWYVLPKTASRGAAENIAGQHAKHYIVIVDEASGVADEIHGVMRGALTEGEGNRYVMISQPTRTTGHFADAFGKLADIYKTFHLNAELSPLVDKSFIHEKLIEYKGHHSPEYQIKVLGKFPDNLSGFLIPARWIEQAQDLVIEHPEPWGWVLCADVAEGLHRDESVWVIARVSGYGENRRVEVVECQAFQDRNEKQFARLIYQRIQDLESVTVAIDGDGAGRTVILELEELGVTIEPIHWGLPPHSKTDQKRYFNQRAFASVKVREAIFEERMKPAPGKTIVEQGSKIPYDLDERGRYKIWSKERMRSAGITSPDHFDAHAFFFLVDYIPIESWPADGCEDEMVKWASGILEGGESKT
mgnify:CR=1 FL=1